MSNNYRISTPLTPELKKLIEKEAKRLNKTVGATVQHLLYKQLANKVGK